MKSFRITDREPVVLADLRGAARLRAASPLPRFLAIGVVSTLAYALLFLGLMPLVGSVVGSALALGITAVGNTAANRRVTFNVRGKDRRLRQYLSGAVVFAIALALTDGSLALLHAADPDASRGLQLAVLVLASLAATVIRYTALRAWVFSASSPAVEQSVVAGVVQSPRGLPSVEWGEELVSRS
jgi:putative flippase GtrA